MTGERVGGAVTWGLPGARGVHDLEELATVPGWLRRNVPGLRKRFPQAPEEVRRRAETMGAAEFATAVGAMGAVVGTAAAAGRLTGGRSGFCQSALTGYGPHGVMHLAQAAAVRGYIPGSVTSPLVVLPFTLWARGRLRKAGVLRPARPCDAVAGSAAAGAATVASHIVARRLLGRGDGGGGRHAGRHDGSARRPS
ncbi:MULTISPECIES: HXXEE domain-containing protein [unclassified Streptomyces]|uniref:HXXEE domain-containing protein n=1 Tax=unclassified Streptomyces TaxID=2593676 RepID=UPI00187D2733|nr:MULTISPECIES: HXXEE domain-containing protein [unclassified Streptomyces]MBU5946033.1 HXXEE domain-containing protein [Streptomyces sp. PAM3C]